MATTHLESWVGPGETKARERVAQLAAALARLQASGARNLLLAGDLNWHDDGEEGSLAARLPPGWLDAWAVLRPGEAGATYDTDANAMLRCDPHPLQARLDRALAKLADWEAADVRLVGTEALPGVTRRRPASASAAAADGEPQVTPVLPSDHFGLLLTLRRRAAAGDG